MHLHYLAVCCLCTETGSEMVGYDRCEGRSGGAKGLFWEAGQCRIRRALVALALR